MIVVRWGAHTSKLSGGAILQLSDYPYSISYRIDLMMHRSFFFFFPQGKWVDGVHPEWKNTFFYPFSKWYMSRCINGIFESCINGTVVRCNVYMVLW